MKYKYSLNFRLEKRKDNNSILITKNVPINLEFNYLGKRLVYFSGYRINADKWIEYSLNEEGEKIKIQRVKKNASNKDGIQYNIINKRLDDLKIHIEDIFIKLHSQNIPIDNEILRLNLNKALNKDKYIQKEKTQFWEKWDEYIENVNVSVLRKKQLQSTMNHFKRFEFFSKSNITFDKISPKILSDFEKFLLKDGYNIDEYANIPTKRRPKPKSQNTVSGNLKRLRAFLNWCMKSENGAVLKENPFRLYNIKSEIYGAPICMNKDERDMLYNEKIVDVRLSRVRDIFCFQCFVGCRYGDLIQLTRNDIINDILVYYPQKTKDENRTSARVPLSGKAKEILKKYDLPNGKLLPTISLQKYDEYLKELFEFVGLKRIVTKLNPLSLEVEHTPLFKLVTSHMARRTFIHILHSKVKDSVIASMSGHVKGSRAFDRYYDVDDETREKAINNYLD